MLVPRAASEAHSQREWALVPTRTCENVPGGLTFDSLLAQQDLIMIISYTVKKMITNDFQNRFQHIMTCGRIDTVN